MKTQNSLRLLALAGGFFYAYLFWQEKLGINTLLFVVFVLFGLFKLRPGLLQNKAVLFAALSAFLATVFISWTNTPLAKIIHLLSLILLAGFVQQKAFRFIGFGIALGFLNLLEAPLLLFSKEWIKDFKWAAQKIRLAIIPLAVVVVFFLIYYNANQRFAIFSNKIQSFFSEQIFHVINPAVFWLFILGLCFSGAVFFSSRFENFFIKRDRFLKSQLIRIKTKKRIFFERLSPLGLKKEYKMGLIVLALLNFQLLIINVLDLRFVWLDYEKKTAFELSQYVHEGTWLLIIAILLAMFVVLWLFRKNLNFYPGNNWLLKLSYFWIFQNGLLAYSVAMRNIQYISHYGLAHKRLGVLFFLILVVFGLWTLVVKIKQKKTFFYLLQRNGWFIYFALLAVSAINWDVLITRYNLQINTHNTVDAHYLIYGITDKNIYVLLEQKEKLISKSHLSETEINRAIERKLNYFLKKQESYGWRSFNLADRRNKMYGI